MIEQDGTGPGQEDGFVDYAFIGQNEKALLKIQDFDAKMRSGIDRQVDVAMMKFCYVDITASTDIEPLFASYRRTVAPLKQDFPKVTFTHVTVPLMTDQRLLSKPKNRLTGSSSDSAAYNAYNTASERLNALIRHEYADDHLFDLAAIESTAPDSNHAFGTYRGQQFYRLYDGYAPDSGHVEGGSTPVAATAWLKAVGQASAK